MAVHYEVKAGESLLVKGPANIVVKTGELPRIGDPEDAEPPEITGLSPDTVESGAPDFTLFIAGSGFTENSVIVFGGQDEPTTLDGEELSTIVKPSLFAPAAVPVAIRNGTLTSAPMDFTFTEPAGARSKKSK